MSTLIMTAVKIVLSIAYILLGAVSIASLLVYYMHMFQLNSYMADEQRRFMKTNKGALLGRRMGYVLSFMLLFIAAFDIVPVCMLCFSALFFFMTAWGNRPWARVAKRPLAVTGRVKRMFVTAGILYMLILAVVITVSAVFFGNIIKVAAVSGFAICALGFITPYILFAANELNRPREKAINRKFINEAKQIIKDSPGLKVIGITGSYGKTSTKFFLTHLLSGTYNVLMTPGNYNTELGVTITVRRDLKPIHEVFVCEMGARRVGEIKAVCDIVRPQTGIITSIGEQHLETFGSIENIINTKLELADAIPPGGRVYINADNEILRERKIGKPVTTYALENKKADFVPQNVRATEKGSEFDLRLPDGETVHFHTPVLGTHNVLNLAGCIAVAYDMKVPVKQLVARAATLKSVPHRLQLINSPRGIMIDDAYNSNPAGARAALETLCMFDGVHILVTPGMVELGEKQYELNKELGREAAAVCDYIVLVGIKQTEPIADGVRAAGFDENRLFVVSDLKEGLSKTDAIKTEGRQKIILLENDLPDNY